MSKKLIVGSPEAMQHEPSLEEPQDQKRKRKKLVGYVPNFKCDAHDPFNDEEDVFPKGIDDSIGG